MTGNYGLDRSLVELYYTSCSTHTSAMISLLRPLATASGSTSRRPIPLLTQIHRQITTTPSSPSEPLTRTTRSAPLPDALASPADLRNLQPPSDPDNWWTARQAGSLASTSSKLPGNQFSGRSIPVKGGRGFTQAYMQLMGVLSRTGVRNDVRNSEFYEKPHVMRNRQKSERHRRRFQEMVSEDARGSDADRSLRVSGASWTQNRVGVVLMIRLGVRCKWYRLLGIGGRLSFQG
jgi:ribosomal protein S21